MTSRMTFNWPTSLQPLQDWVAKRGLDVLSLKTDRQAAFMCQQLVGSRIKFPADRNESMVPTLLKIQAAMPGGQETDARAVAPVSRLPASSPAPLGKSKRQTTNSRVKKSYPAVDISSGLHVFCDGACIPNPGPGGWGFVVYQHGQEIASDCGGDAAATNNIMELTALLQAVKWAHQYPASVATIWCDSQYAVRGANEWRHGWKAKGWRRGGDNAKEKNQSLANVDLWKAIDEALLGSRAAGITIKWLKGHAGTAGNDRADELAEIGRTSAGSEELRRVIL